MIASLYNNIAKARFTVIKLMILPASFEPCDTPYPQSNTGIAVLYMPANSIGKIMCKIIQIIIISQNHKFSIFDPKNSYHKM